MLATLAAIVALQQPAMAISPLAVVTDGKKFWQAGPTRVLDHPVSTFAWSQSGETLAAIVHVAQHDLLEPPESADPRAVLRLYSRSGSRLATLQPLKDGERFISVRPVRNKEAWIIETTDRHLLVRNQRLVAEGEPLGDVDVYLRNDGSAIAFAMDMTFNISWQERVAQVALDQARHQEWQGRSLQHAGTLSNGEPYIVDYSDRSGYTFDLETGELKPWTRGSPHSSRELIAELRSDPEQAGRGMGQLFAINAPLNEQFRFAEISRDCTQIELSTGETNLAHISEATLYLREIKPIPRSKAVSFLERLERMRLESLAKQVATAIHIYMADHNDELPPQAGWQDALLPYTKNRQMLDGFVYTRPDPEKLLNSPPETSLGYARGRFGRAIARGDSSVRWESDKAEPNQASLR